VLRTLDRFLSRRFISRQESHCMFSQLLGAFLS
jgi:hypothetical protein